MIAKNTQSNSKKDSSKNYVYRMTHDTGFAPNIKNGICILSGCKKTTIEIWAQTHGWVIGIGGNDTGKPDKLIYAMEVKENIPYCQFNEKYRERSKYLKKKKAGTNVLISRKFYYFGNNAIDLPKELKHIIIDRQGCKCVSNEDVRKLEKHLGYRYGKFGNPNNGQNNGHNGSKCKKC